jgi:hypothetical protein
MSPLIKMPAIAAGNEAATRPRKEMPRSGERLPGPIWMALMERSRPKVLDGSPIDLGGFRQPFVPRYPARREPLRRLSRPSIAPSGARPRSIPGMKRGELCRRRRRISYPGECGMSARRQLGTSKASVIAWPAGWPFRDQGIPSYSANMLPDPHGPDIRAGSCGKRPMEER